MKKLLFTILLTLGVNCFAGITLLRIEPSDGKYECTAWGLADMGAEKHFLLTDKDTTFAKIFSLVTDQAGGKDFIRALVYFNEDGSIQKIDVHTSGGKKFDAEVKEIAVLSDSAKIDSVDIKAELEAVK